MNNTFLKKEALTSGLVQFKENAFLLIGSVIIIGLTVLAVDIFNIFLNISVFSYFAISVVAVFIAILLEMGLIRIALNIQDKKEVGFGDLFGEASRFVRYFLAQILASIIILIGFLLLIVPGVIAMVGLFFVPYIIIDKSSGPIEAVKSSWKLTKGHKWSLFLFLSTLVVINIFGFLAFIVGLLITAPVTLLASLYVYKWLDKQDNQVLQEEGKDAS